MLGILWAKVKLKTRVTAIPAIVWFGIIDGDTKAAASVVVKLILVEKVLIS